MIALIKAPDLMVRNHAPSLDIGSVGSTLGSSNGTRFLLILSYAGLILNTSTTLSALLLIDQLGKLPFMSKDLAPTITASSMRSGHRLLGRYHASKKAWDILGLHCCLTLFTGFLTITAQALTFIWIHEERAVAIAMVAMSFCLIPFLMIFVVH
ncbi:hypothetical protein FRB95_013801 [Tulasnella sp. JGI-2019a]|nr:hypothetical protein FRB95_013801 [Tulasnella sp. JGI-2019a]